MSAYDTTLDRYELLDRIEVLEVEIEQLRESLAEADRRYRAHGWRQAAHEAGSVCGLTDDGIQHLLRVADDIQTGKRT